MLEFTNIKVKMLANKQMLEKIIEIIVIFLKSSFLLSIGIKKYKTEKPANAKILLNPLKNVEFIP